MASHHSLSSSLISVGLLVYFVTGQGADPNSFAATYPYHGLRPQYVKKSQEAL
jgi:hypothetical protein